MCVYTYTCISTYTYMYVCTYIYIYSHSLSVKITMESEDCRTHFLVFSVCEYLDSTSPRN